MAGLQEPYTALRGKEIPRRALTEDIWELYNANDDFSQANNLADKNPEKLAELQKVVHGRSGEI